MVNKKIGEATKGSRYCLQNYMNDNSDNLSDLILAASTSLLSFSEGTIKWVSPKSSNDFYEYRDDFLKGLNIENINLSDIETKLRNFWPKNGPQWDGLAVVEGREGEKGVLLVEAKAHPAETQSDLKATSQKSIELINESMKVVQGYMGVQFNDWTKEHYQLANRISYLYFMNIIANIPTWLVLVNFIGDKSYKETSIKEWLNHYKEVYKRMGIDENCKLLDRIILIFPKAL